VTDLPAGDGELEPELVARIGSDPDALEAFYRAHYAPLLRYFTARVSDPHEVADLVADTFLAAMSAAEGYDPRRGRPIAWVFGIAANVRRRSVRRREAERRAAGRLAGRRLLDDEDVARIEEQIDAHRRLAGRRPLERLTPAEREVVELVDVAGFSVNEAATAVGITSGSARVRLFRARAKLRQALQMQEDRT
jgi:RNA polymerase sigma-70 factor (ECF subfamily)